MAVIPRASPRGDEGHRDMLNSKPNGGLLTVAIAAFGVLTGLGGLFWQAANPKGDLNQVRADLREDLRQSEDRHLGDIKDVKSAVETRVQTLLNIREHNEFARRVDKDLSSLRDEIMRLRTGEVTRSEHQQHWQEIADRIQGVRGLIDEFRREQATINADLRKEFGSTYTAGDQIKNLQAQIVKLADRLDTFSQKSAPTSTVLGQRTSPASP